ncbi:Satratoxin biosynthesis SC1 cluster protein, partial [Lachnellula suecica]
HGHDQVGNGEACELQNVELALGAAGICVDVQFSPALFASILTYNFGLTFTKLSILQQNLRIAVNRSTRRAIYCVMFLVVAYCIETLFNGLLTCSPIAFFWDVTIPGGRCIDRWPLYFANAGINIVEDLMVLALPFFILKPLVIPMRQKMCLIGVLALGGVACIASILRLRSLYVLYRSQDPTWDSPGPAFWSVIELNIGIFCGSISTLHPLLSKYLPWIFPSIGGTRSSQPTSSYVATANTRPSNRHSFRVLADEVFLASNYRPAKGALRL